MHNQVFLPISAYAFVLGATFYSVRNIYDGSHQLSFLTPPFYKNAEALNVKLCVKKCVNFQIVLFTKHK